MKKLLLALCLPLAVFFILQACSNPAPQKAEQPKQSSEDSLAACTPIKDPNNPKPMALMMRIMAAHADSMRSQILRGEALDSADYPFVKFYLMEPTDPAVLEPQFYENARLYQMAHKELFAHPKESKKYYNLLINSCIHCHESYCSGPLKRIRKFPIE